MDRRAFLKNGIVTGVATVAAGGLVIASDADVSRYAGRIGVVDPTHFGLAIAGTVLYTQDGQPVGIVERLLEEDSAKVIGVSSFLARVL